MLIFSVTLHDDNVQEFDTRWDEVLQSMSDIPQMISWKVCANWEYVSPRNLKLYWNCKTWRFNFKKKRSLEEQTAQIEDPFFRGRHTAYLTCKYFGKTEHMKLFLIIEINSVLLRMATILRISITVGIKFFYQLVKFPLAVFWKVCSRDERESRQLVRVLCRVWSRALVRSPLACHPRSKAIGLPVLTKFSHQKGMNWNRSIGQYSERKECQSWKESKRLRTVERKRTVYKGNACRFRHDDSTCGQQAPSSSLVPSVCLLHAAGHILWTRGQITSTDAQRDADAVRSIVPDTAVLHAVTREVKAGAQEGLEAWRYLVLHHEPTSLTRSAGLSQELLNFSFAGETAARMEQFWPRHRPLRESERRDVPRNLRIGVALRMLPDGPLKQHLVLNSTRLTTWVILKAEIDNVRRAQAV